ncbi:MAG: hypothetical protein AB1489_36235 [Acidobacteriota bacterium]
MTQLKVKSESLPVRCDICHQADCFDAQLNYCTRCASTLYSTEAKNSQSTSVLLTARLALFSACLRAVIAIGFLLFIWLTQPIAPAIMLIVIATILYLVGSKLKPWLTCKYPHYPRLLFGLDLGVTAAIVMLLATTLAGDSYGTMAISIIPIFYLFGERLRATLATRFPQFPQLPLALEMAIIAAVAILIWLATPAGSYILISAGIILLIIVFLMLGSVGL